MTSYVFRVRTPDQAIHRVERYDLADLDAALAQAQRLARMLVRTPARRGLVIGGSLDVEVELDRPVARLMLREVARQIS